MVLEKNITKRRAFDSMGIIKAGNIVNDMLTENIGGKGLIRTSIDKNLSILKGLNERIISSVASNWWLPVEAWKTRRELEPQKSKFGKGDSDISLTNSTPIHLENKGSESTLGDLTKLSYKEIYAIYQLTDSHIRNDWQEIRFVDDLQSGLDARVFVNNKTHEINFSFEGSHGFTKLLAENIADGELFKDLKKCSDNFTRHATAEEYDRLFAKWHHVLGQDGLSDLQIFANKIPDQFYMGYTWFKKMEDQLATSEYSGYKQVITGHSLAGGLAQLISAQYQLETGKAIATISWQGPGMLTQMEQLAGRDLKPQEFSQIVNFVTEGDPVGEFFNERHVGLTVPMPYTLARNDEHWALKYRFGIDLFQKVTGVEDIRVDRHEIGQQMDIFDGTDFTYPEHKVILTDQQDTYTGIWGRQELIMGYGGNDTIVGGSANDYICGGTGYDMLYGGAGNDFIIGEEGDDKLFGDAGNDLLYGGKGNDYLDGGSGDDGLYGGSGDDVLVWSEGNDLLYGQQGDDTYLLGTAKTSGNVTLKFDREESGHDIVKFNIAAIDPSHSHITFLMSDHILPSDFTVAQNDKDLLIHYDQNSTILMENWAEVSTVLGNNITFKFGCSPLEGEFKLGNTSLFQVG